MVVARVGHRIWHSALSAQISIPPQSGLRFRCTPIRPFPSPITALTRSYSSSTRRTDPTSRPASDFHVAATDVQHAEFVAQAKAKSPFEVSDRDKQGSSGGILPKDEGVSRDGKGSDADRARQGSGPPSLTDGTGSETGTYVGKLSPTSSHLFKLIIPLPPSLHSVIGTQTENRSTVPSPKMIDTAFLLHPSQPLSHVSRLILGSLPASERDAEVEFRAVSGREHNAYPSLANTMSDQPAEQGQSQADQATDDAGGPLLYERNPDGGELQEVRWSTSTDLGDFIKQATLAQHFRIVLKPSWETDMSQTTSEEPANSDPTANAPKAGTIQPREPELSLKIMIPTFDSRTKFLRKRLLYLTREIAVITDKKKELDRAAHRGAQRIAIGGLMGLVGYWGVVFKLTFFSPLGWDVMEPVTYLSGLSTLICSYLFFLYHNREVSYSSVLDLSVSARQKSLYEKAGLDLERWTEMVSEAKALRREIQRVAQDYDYDWKGQLEDLEHVDIVNRKDEPTTAHASRSGQGHESSGKNLSAVSNASSTTAGSQAETKQTPRTYDVSSTESTRVEQEKSDNSSSNTIEKIDIDATIDEAVELERQTRSKERQRRHGKGGKGEAMDSGRDQGEKRAKKYVVGQDIDD